MLPRRGIRLIALVGALLAASPAVAQELRIGLATEPASLDPLLRTVGPDEQVARHFYDSLILQGERQQLIPGLAVSWRPVSETVWEFRLRQGVRFSDGSEFNAEDAAATIRRAPNVPNASNGYGIYTRQVTEIEVVDTHTIRLHTAAPYPMMAYDISPVWIISHKAETATTEDFNTGRAMIGTGPFRLIEWVKGERLVLERNDDYWGPKPAWKRVALKFIPSDSARVAALLSGDVDFIELVPPSALANLRSHAELRIAEALSSRIIYLALDSYRDRTPFATDVAGSPLDRNPLRDWRVRKAISKAIDRHVIVERVMDGLATEAGQLVPDEYYGASRRLAVEAYDPEAAKQLLSQAGYPNGFGITLHAANNRYVNGEKVAISIGQMLARVGIQARVETLPESIYKSRASNYDYSLFTVGWFSDTGEASSPLRGMVATQGFHGWGQANRGRYSNPELDRLLTQAMTTMDDSTREQLLQGAMEIAINDVAVVPIHFEGGAWAFRKDLAYKGRTDQFTLAQEVTRAP